MKAYFSYFKMRLIHTLQYRTQAFAGMITQFFWGFMEVYLYRAFYLEHAEAFPMEFSALVCYIWLRQAFLALLNTWVFEKEIIGSVQSGAVTYELLRPVSLYGMWYARTAAVRVSKALLRFWPILLVAFLLPEPLGMRLPPSAGTLLAFLVCLLLTLLVTVAFSMIVYFSSFFTISTDGLRAVLTPVSDLLCGGLIPLPFMPDALSRIIRYSPFGAMLNAPLRVYSGNISGASLAETIALQLFWLAALVAIGVMMMKKGLKKLVIQGG